MSRECRKPARRRCSFGGRCIGCGRHDDCCYPAVLQATERSYRWKHPRDFRPPSLGGSVSTLHPAWRSAAGRSRVNALVSVLHLTRTVAAGRIRRGRWARGHATSWRPAQAGRGCVGGTGAAKVSPTCAGHARRPCWPWRVPGRRPGRPPRPCGRFLAKGAACRRPARRSVANCCSGARSRAPAARSDAASRRSDAARGRSLGARPCGAPVRHAAARSPGPVAQ